MTEKEWLKNVGFRLMIKRMEEIGEWAMSKYEIPCKEYEKLTGAFNPIYFNADEWVQLAKDAINAVQICF